MQITPFLAFIAGMAVSGVAFFIYGTYLLRKEKKRILAQAIFSVMLGTALEKEAQKCNEKKID